MTMQPMIDLECANVDVVGMGQRDVMRVSCRSTAVCRCWGCNKALCVLHQLPDGRCWVCTLGDAREEDER